MEEKYCIPYVEDYKNVIKNRYPLHFIGGTHINGYFWTSALEWNGYYRLDLETGRTELLGLFDHADIWADKLFSQILEFQQFVFFIPWFSDYLVRLDTRTLEMKYWKVPENSLKEAAKFRAAYLYGESIFMFPHCGDDICIFNINKETFKQDRSWLREADIYMTEDINNKFTQGYKIEDNVYLGNLSGNFMMKYNLSNSSYKIIPFEKKERKIVHIERYKNNKLLVLTWKGDVWEYNIRNDTKKCIFNYKGEIENPYSIIIFYEDLLYLIPGNEKEIKVFEKGKEYLIKYPDKWRLYFIDVDFDSTFGGYYKDENQFYLYPAKGNMLIKINQRIAEGIAVYESIENRAREIFRRIEMCKGTNRLLIESRIDLKILLRVLGKMGTEKERINHSNNCGTRIWNRIKI